jgi:ribosomal protein L9
VELSRTRDQLARRLEKELNINKATLEDNISLKYPISITDIAKKAFESYKILFPEQCIQLKEPISKLGTHKVCQITFFLYFIFANCTVHPRHTIHVSLTL